MYIISIENDPQLREVALLEDRGGQGKGLF